MAGTYALDGELGKVTWLWEVAVVALAVGSWGTGQTQWHCSQHYCNDYGIISCGRAVLMATRHIVNMMGPLHCKGSGLWLVEAVLGLVEAA